MKKNKELTSLQKAIIEKAKKSRDMLPKGQLLELVNAQLEKPVKSVKISQCLSGYQFDANVLEAVIKAGLAYDDRLMKMAQ